MTATKMLDDLQDLSKGEHDLLSVLSKVTEQEKEDMLIPDLIWGWADRTLEFSKRYGLSAMNCLSKGWNEAYDDNNETSEALKRRFIKGGKNGR